jgi:putative serine protease PepD
MHIADIDCIPRRIMLEEQGKEKDLGEGQSYDEETYVEPGFVDEDMLSASQRAEILAIIKSTRPIPKRMKISAFTFPLLLIGSAIGGGVGVTLGSALAEESISAVSNNGIIEVTNLEDINWLTAAAIKATPSSVSILSRSAGGFSSGSGIVYDTEGHIITSAHLFKHGDFKTEEIEAEVRFSNGEVVSATLINVDLSLDLALLKLNNSPKTYDLVPATWRDSNTIQVGEYAATIGSPLDMFNSVAKGVISATDRVIQLNLSDRGLGDNSLELDSGNNFISPSQSITLRVIQTDAPINPGNSGGGLIDHKGNFIGLNAAILGGDATRGLGFSIPSNTVTRVISNMVDTGSSTNALLGASAVDKPFTFDDAPSLSDGAWLVEISETGAAASSGIEKDFIVNRVNDMRISSAADLIGTIRSLNGGSEAQIGGYYLYSPEELLDFSVTLGVSQNGY